MSNYRKDTQSNKDDSRTPHEADRQKTKLDLAKDLKQNGKDEGSADTANVKRRPRTPEEWQSLATQQIEEAIERGDFDNLPGYGKPLNLSENPNEPADMQMANRLLKNNELAPSWIIDRKTLVAEVDAVRADVERRLDWYRHTAVQSDDEQARSTLAADWAAQLAAWDEAIADLNRRILDLNLSLPIWRMELMRFNLDRELARLGAGRSMFSTD